MSRHVSELSMKELSEAAAEAGARAVAEAHAAGLAVTGYARDAEGNLWLARLFPNGVYEWVERVPEWNEPLDAQSTVTSTEKNFAG